MARIIYSSLVTSINGSAGGTTFQRNLYGSTIKNKPHMPTPRSSYQNEMKMIIAAVTSRWRTLSDAERQSYIDYASTYPYPTRLNPDAYLNGFNYFVKYNSLRVLAGLAVLGTVSLTQQVLSVTGIDIEDDGSDLIFSFTYTALASNWQVLIFLSPKINSFSSPKSNKTRFIKDFSTAGVTSGTNITTEYPARFGETITDGDSVYADITFVNQTSGQILELPTQVVTVV